MAPTLTGGSKRTAEFTKALGKPWLHVRADDPFAGNTLGHFVISHAVRILNVAGARGSNEPSIAGFVHRALDDAFRVRPGWLGGAK
ncbi:MAG: YpsA SLOG family protein [Verrucomicrobiales bacterium]